MTLKVIIGLIFLYLVLRFVLRFVLPIFRIVRTTQQKMGEINNRMNQMEAEQRKAPTAKVKKEGEYIDYEEIK